MGEQTVDRAKRQPGQLKGEQEVGCHRSKQLEESCQRAESLACEKVTRAKQGSTGGYKVPRYLSSCHCTVPQ